MLPTVFLQRAMWLSNVDRWAIVPTLRKQSVAEHSYRVTLLSVWVANYLLDCQPKKPFMVSAEKLLLDALTHDREEALTGDVPSIVKTPKNVDEMAPTELIIKLADDLEALLFVEDEMAMGNQSIAWVHDDIFYKGSRSFAALKGKIGLDKGSWHQMLTECIQRFGIGNHPARNTTK